jgi:uncharacterized Fe-S cluster protein YjdI
MIGEDRNREYTNGEITVFWRPAKCIHATTCYKELIEVFNPRKRPWVNMEGAPTERIIEVVDKCPTRAIYWKRNTELAKPVQEEPVEKIEKAKETEVKVMADGPLVVRGDFEIIDSEGKTLKKMKIASFCRCGHSMNMPFCDGNHRKMGFQSK